MLILLDKMRTTLDDEECSVAPKKTKYQKMFDLDFPCKTLIDEFKSEKTYEDIEYERRIAEFDALQDDLKRRRLELDERFIQLQQELLAQQQNKEA